MRVVAREKVPVTTRVGRGWDRMRWRIEMSREQDAPPLIGCIITLMPLDCSPFCYYIIVSTYAHNAVTVYDVMFLN